MTIEALLIDSDIQSVGIISDILFNEFGAIVTHQINGDMAVAHLSMDSAFNLIIVKNLIETKESAKQILNYLIDQKLNIPVIVIGPCEFSGYDFHSLKSDFKSMDLIKIALKASKLKKEELEEIKLPDYIPVPLEYFLTMTHTACDVFLKLDKKDGQPYIKRLRAGDGFEQNVIEKYKAANLKYLYIKKQFRHAFMDSLIEQTLRKLDKEPMTDSEVVQVTEESFNIAQDMIAKFGIDTNTVKIVSKTLKTIERSIASSPKLSSLLKELLNSPDSYTYKHSQLISLFGYKLIPMLNWGGEQNFDKNFEKFSFIAFFHDIMLPQEVMSRIGSKLELYKANLSESDKELVLNHANLIATEVQKYPKAPSGVDVIIRQHHGVSNGVGFAETNSSSLSSMSIAFIVIEEFVKEIIDFNKKTDTLTELMTRLEKKFAGPSYKKIVDLIKNIVSQI